MHQRDYFFCYNKQVSDYLISKGIKCITIARELKNNKIFALFQQSEELSQALKEYKLIK